MKITLIYGTHGTASRLRYQKILDAVSKKNWDIINLEKDKQSFISQLGGKSLFENNSVYVLDGLSRLEISAFEWLKQNSTSIEGNLLIYQVGAIPAKMVQYFSKNAKLEKFDLPKTVFSLLDSLFPGNSKKALQLLHEVVVSEPIEFIFALISSLYRDLYWVKLGESLESINAWRLSKLKKQTQTYSLEKLEQIINYLAKMDIEVKTSQSNLAQQLDLLITTELK